MHLLWSTFWANSTRNSGGQEGRKLKQRHSLPGWGLRKRAAYVGVSVFLVGRLDHEDDIVFGFEGGDDGAITGLVGDGFTVDRSNDRGLAEADLIGKRAGTNAGDDHAALDAG